MSLIRARCRPFCYTRMEKPFPDFIQFEDLPSDSAGASFSSPEDETVSQDEEEVSKCGKFYVPPPFADDDLLKVPHKAVDEWPKSRVVWALGRLGFVHGRLSNKFLSQKLIERAAFLASTMTTRDMIRFVQAVSYGAIPIDPSPLFAVRRALCANIDRVSELYLLSLIYGHFKLIGRIDWTISPNCDKTSQFLLSELIHRKGKLDANAFLEISAVILSNPKVIKSHKDSVHMILKHACEVLRHSRDQKVMMKFAKTMCGLPCEEFFPVINETMQKKFQAKKWRSASDALHAGFYFHLANLMSVGTLSDWLEAMRLAAEPLVDGDFEMLHLLKTTAEQRSRFPLLPDELQKYIEAIPAVKTPKLSIESVHVYSVLRRMSDACTKNYFASALVGPFLLPVCNESEKVFLEWLDGHELESPHKRGIIERINSARRWFLETNGWTVISLNRSDFKPADAQSLLEMNKKFKTLITASFPALKIEWKEDLLPESDRPRLMPEPRTVESQPRERWESRTREFRMKSHLKLMQKRFRKNKKSFKQK